MLSSSASDHRRRLLILDFDGTVCLGDEPAMLYAHEADELIAQHGLPGLGRSIARIVAQALSSDSLAIPEIEVDGNGEPPLLRESFGVQGAHPVAWPLQDGYQLVQLLGRQAGLNDAQTGQAFMAARRRIVRDGLEQTDVHAPEEAGRLIAEMRAAGVRVVLITNSPAEGFDRWLDALGLHESFDEVINSARKPYGMPEALQQAARHDDLNGLSILSVGDIWKNDLAPVADLGGETVLIDRFGTGLGAPDHRVSSFDEAVSMMRTWADAPTPG
ncbi:HAD family hydrolase [Nesterenkonia sp. NBAIMH1]|uniref:HAD family hydrolase n=1 Tax=Nesterenkonia sp. NBAIMH1 TaxID=2600320 RepID=UPI00143D6EFF|nr:HAD family hydrolase [Nesterenkonia sp. NBAIMH1]